MLAMSNKPEESKCDNDACQAIGITERTRVSLSITILLCQRCARIWDMATSEQIANIRKINKGE